MLYTLLLPQSNFIDYRPQGMRFLVDQWVKYIFSKRFYSVLCVCVFSEAVGPEINEEFHLFKYSTRTFILKLIFTLNFLEILHMFPEMYMQAKSKQSILPSNEH